MKPRHKKAKALARHRRRGSLLISMIVLLTTIGLLAGTLTSMVGSTTQVRLFHKDANRAYLLAESGAAYVNNQRKIDPYALPAGLFTLENGDQFRLNSTFVDADTIRVVSTGISRPGEENQVRRQLTFIINNPPNPNEMMDIGFDFNEDRAIDNTWSFEGLINEQIQRPVPRQALKFDLALQEAQVKLEWQNDPEIDWVRYWVNNGNRLDYEVQVKIGNFKRSGVNTRRFHYLVGISFRLSPDTNTSYGLSYFQSRLVDENNLPTDPPDWVPDAWSFLRGPDVHLVLWHRSDADTFNLLAYRTLTASDELTDFINNGYVLREFAGLLVGLEEQIDGMGNRSNHIKAYTSRPDLYPDWLSVLDVEWPEDANIFATPVTWDSPITDVVVNNTLTSASFGASPSTEISLHVISDFVVGGPNIRIFLDDFAIREEGNIPIIPPTQQF